MLGDSIIFPGWLSVILIFSKHLSRTSFAVIYPVFLLPPPHRMCSLPFGSSCLWPCSLCLPQPSPGSEIPILPPFPWKSQFPKALIALIVLSWTPPTLFWRNGKLPALFQQNPVSVLSTLCFAAVWNLPEGNSLLLQQHHVGDCCHCASCSNFWALSAKNVFFSACEAGSSCWTSWYFFSPCLLNYRLLLLSFVKVVWNLKPPRCSFHLPIKICKFNEHNLQSLSRSLVKQWTAQNGVSLLCKQHHSIYPEFPQWNYFPSAISWRVLRALGAGGSMLVTEGKSEAFASCET